MGIANNKMTRTETKVKTSTKNGQTVEETTTTTHHDDGRTETHVSTKTVHQSCGGRGPVDRNLSSHNAPARHSQPRDDDHSMDHHFGDFDQKYNHQHQRALDNDLDRIGNDHDGHRIQGNRTESRTKTKTINGHTRKVHETTTHYPDGTSKTDV